MAGKATSSSASKAKPKKASATNGAASKSKATTKKPKAASSRAKTKTTATKTKAKAKAKSSGGSKKKSGAKSTASAQKPAASAAASTTTASAKSTTRSRRRTGGNSAPRPRTRVSGAETGAARPSAAKLKKLQYKEDQRLVYPLQGVGHVEQIEERTFRDETLLYYIVYLEVSDMTIMVPVDRADELGIRAIVPKTEANKALRLIGEEYEPIPTDWKLRYQMNLDLLKRGAVTDIATVVRALYHRSKIKELPILERKLYDNALTLLVDEISFSLGKEKSDVEEMIFSRLDAVRK